MIETVIRFLRQGMTDIIESLKEALSPYAYSVHTDYAVQ